MQTVALLAAVFAHMGLTIVLLFRMGYMRLRAVQRREVRVGDIALGQQAWPEAVTKVSNAFRNQLELPVLFYVLAIIAILTRQADHVMVALAWVFVVLRLIHAIIHTTNNNVLNRFRTYVAGAVVLAAMWGYLAVRILLAGGA